MEEKPSRPPSLRELPRSLVEDFAFQRWVSLVLACALLAYLAWLGVGWLWGHL